jgi:hypothetical protein
MNPDDVLENVICARAHNSEQQVNIDPIYVRALLMNYLDGATGRCCCADV